MRRRWTQGNPSAGRPDSTPYLRTYNGRFKGALRWPDFDGLWAQLQRLSDGIVYADDHDEPSFVKIFDPGNLGTVCGSSEIPTLPGWTLSRLAPDDLEEAMLQPREQPRWWRRILGSVR